MKKQLFSAAIILFIIINFSYAYNPEHLKILLRKDISDAWDQWTKKNPRIKANFSGAVINDVCFTGNFLSANFRNAKISNSVLVNADFIHTDLSHSEIRKINSFLIYPSNRDSFICKNSVFFKANILDSKFISADFSGTNFNESVIQNTEFSSCSIKNSSFVKAKIIKLKLYSNYSNFVDFSNSEIITSTIVAIIPQVDKIHNIKFNHAKIHESTIAGWLYNASFTNADLTNSSFFYFKIPDGSILTNVNFTNTNLTNVNFQKTKFQNVIFKNADMTGAKLERKWHSYVKKQGVRNFDKIQWM